MTAEPSLEPVRANKLISFKIIKLEGKVFSNQTVNFPITSSIGNKYIMVMFVDDANVILAEPLKSRSERDIVNAMIKLHTYLTDRGFKPKTRIIDNECPEALKRHFQSNNIDFQLVPPHLHRFNKAENAIGTFEDHFIAGLASFDPSFPMHLWYRLLPNATTTLNLLRPSAINPRIPAKAQLNGAFDYNRTPLAPPGAMIIAYVTPDGCLTWDPHGLDGWYIGYAPEHYRCHRVYITKTRAKRIARTVDFFPYLYAMPKTSSVDAAMEAALDLTNALQNPHPITPFANVGHAQLSALW